MPRGAAASRPPTSWPVQRPAVLRVRRLPGSPPAPAQASNQTRRGLAARHPSGSSSADRRWSRSEAGATESASSLTPGGSGRHRSRQPRHRLASCLPRAKRLGRRPARPIRDYQGQTHTVAERPRRVRTGWAKPQVPSHPTAGEPTARSHPKPRDSERWRRCRAGPGPARPAPAEPGGQESPARPPPRAGPGPAGGPTRRAQGWGQGFRGGGDRGRAEERRTMEHLRVASTRQLAW